jgi:hypothetical protein
LGRQEPQKISYSRKLALPLPKQDSKSDEISMPKGERKGIEERG